MKTTLILAILALLLIAACTTEPTGQTTTQLESEPPAWMQHPISDVRTGEEFTIAELNDRKILLEPFAVWCPNCKRQQDEVKKLHEEIGDEVISIGLNADPNEDEQQVLSYIERHGYDWRYVVAPATLTQQLVEEFGRTVVNAPASPMILVCEDGSSRMLPTGFKSVNDLKEEISKGCF